MRSIRVACGMTFLCLIMSGCSTSSNYKIGQSKELIERQRDISSIRSLQAKYFELVDSVENQKSNRPDAKEMISLLFSKNGAWTLKINGGDDLVFKGAKRLPDFVKYLEKIYKQGIYIKHMGSGSQVSISGNTATSKEQMLVFYNDNNKDHNLFVIGYYDDVLERNPDNTWRFKSKSLRITKSISWVSSFKKLR